MATLPAWPDFVISPCPLREGLRHDLPDTTLRSDFEQGFRQRDVFRNGVMPIYERHPMTPQQYAFFQSFQNIVGGGWFTKLVFVNDRYLECRVCFKKGTVQAQMEGGEWIVTFQLETMDKVFDAEAEYVVNLLAYGGDIGEFLVSLHRAAHYDWPGGAP